MVCIILPANRETGQPPQNTTTHRVTYPQHWVVCRCGQDITHDTGYTFYLALNNNNFVVLAVLPEVCTPLSASLVNPVSHVQQALARLDESSTTCSTATVMANGIEDAPVFSDNNNNFLAVSHVQQTGVWQALARLNELDEHSSRHIWRRPDDPGWKNRRRSF